MLLGKYILMLSVLWCLADEVNIGTSNSSSPEIKTRCVGCIYTDIAAIDSEWKYIECRECDFQGIRAMRLRANAITIEKSSFVKANLTDARMVAVRAYRADFSYSNLSGANLSRSDLRFANFTQADLSEANLEGTLLDEAVFLGARFNQKTRLPFSRDQALQRGMTWVP